MSDEASKGNETPPAPSRAARIITPIVIFLLMLGIIEVFLQVAAPLPYSSRLWWVNDGHVKGRLEPHQDPINPAGNVVEINDLGFRGPMPSWEPAPGTLRVVTLGGSSTFCYDVSDDEHTWPALLEGELEEALGMPVEVINLGLPGYDASNSKVNYLFTGRALSPHVVAVYHSWNDFKFFRLIDRTEGAPRWVLSGREAIGSNLSPLIHFFWNSQVVQRFALVIRRNKSTSQENLYTSMEEEGNEAHQPVGENAWAWFDENFEDVARFARADGALPVFISQATLAHPDNLDADEERVRVSNHILGMTFPRLVETWQEANQHLETVASEQDAVYVNGYEGIEPTLENLKDHVHLLDPGTARMAALVAETLMADPRFVATAERVKRGEEPTAIVPEAPSELEAATEEPPLEQAPLEDTEAVIP